MRTLIVIQARLASTRLPGKALRPLGGRPMLAFLLERLRPLEGTLCLATTTRPEDSALAELAAGLGVAVVRGEEDDVLARYLRCLAAFPAQAVVRVTADNPLTCPDLVTAAAELVLAGADYAALPEGCPKGLAADAFAPQALQRLAEAARLPEEREHINLHVLRHPELYRRAAPELPPEAWRPDLSFTVDTAEEYAHLREFVERHCGQSPPLTPETLVAAHARAYLS